MKIRTVNTPLPPDTRGTHKYLELYTTLKALKHNQHLVVSPENGEPIQIFRNRLLSSLTQHFGKGVVHSRLIGKSIHISITQENS